MNKDCYTGFINVLSPNAPRNNIFIGSFETDSIEVAELIQHNLTKFSYTVVIAPPIKPDKD